MGSPDRKEDLRISRPAPPAIRRRRLWLFRLLAPILAPLIFFGGLEGVLRLGGYGHPTAFFLSLTVGSQPAFVENPRFSWRFFGPDLARASWPVVLPAVKPERTVRIFVLGESAAYGDPQPDFGLPRMLAALLGDRYPGVRFELVNAAMVAINSNVILPISRECAEHDGDIWVIYMGNNEVVGPYGSGTVFGSQSASLPVIRASLALKATRTGQLLGSLLQPPKGAGGAPVEWKGMMMFVENKVRQDDPGMARVYSNFQRNLNDILEAGRRHHVRMVVSTIVSNLKDCAPFASLHREGLTAAQLQEWDRLYSAGIDAEKAGNPDAAIGNYARAGQLDDHFADLEFRWARCSLALGRDEEARRHFVLARDFDALRFRADSRINEIIRQNAGGREQAGILLADAEVAFSRESPRGLPGHEWLYEHVHLNFEGNYFLARTLADEVVRLLPESVSRQATARTQWLSPDGCARRLAWTDWSHYQALQNLPVRYAPFTFQLDHDEQYRRLRQEIEKLLPASDADSLQRTANLYLEALAVAPEDWVLHRGLAQVQRRLGDLPGAVQSWNQVARLLPHNGEAQLQLGVLLLQQGAVNEAMRHVESQLELDPRGARAGFVKLLNSAAIEMMQQGRVQAAIQFCRQALAFEPNVPEFHINLALALLAQGTRDEAHEHLRLALAKGASAPDSLVTLGRACYDQGWYDEAIRSFQRALEMDPAGATLHCQLGDALAAAGRHAEAISRYSEALRLEPEFAEAHSRLGGELCAQNRIEDGVKELAEAVRLNPRLVDAQVNWGIALFNSGKKAEAANHFEEALRLNPAEPQALHYLSVIRAEKQEGR